MRTGFLDFKWLGNRAALLGSALLILAAAAQADTVVYSTFGSGMSVNGGGSLGVGGSIVFLGAPFTPSATVDLTSLTGNWSGSINAQFTPAPITVSLWTNSSGDPGAELESWTVTVVESPANYTVTSVPGVLLTAGNTYWAVEDYTDGTPNFNNLAWGANSGATSQGLWESLTSAQSLHLFFSTLNPALEVQGTPVSTSTVPEPSSLMLLGTGLLGVLGAMRRKLLG